MTEVVIGRRERKKEETKQRIFQAAVELFREKGFEAATVDEIAERADVAKGTFFNYFPRKEGLVEYLAEENLEGVEAAAVDPSLPAAERLRRIYDALADGYEKSPELARLVMRSALERFCCPSPGGAWQRFEELAIRVIRDGQERGEFRRDQDPHVVHGAVVSCWVGSVVWWLGEHQQAKDPAIRELRLKQVVRALQGVALDGVRA